MKAVVGLGNPGWVYKSTRHNVGFMALDRAAEALGVRVRRRSLKSLVAEAECDGQRVVFAKPQTFMNLSGDAVRAILRAYGLKAQDLVILCDDVSLPLGRIRVRASGSAGGHNGLKSIIGSLGTDTFPRIRMGIGAPERSNMTAHVLSRFHREERVQVASMIERAAEAALTILREGVDAAMNRFNARI
jgi:peptidyl-tRNA hydrolase, PTH1 family